MGMRPIIPPSSHNNMASNGVAKKQLQPKHSYGDLLASNRRPPTLQRMGNKSRGRRSHSEFRPPPPLPTNGHHHQPIPHPQHHQPMLLKLNDENVNPLNLHPHHGHRKISSASTTASHHSHRDLNGNNCKDNSDYAELSSHNEKRIRKTSRVSRSKSRVKGSNGGQHQSGLQTVWPGKTGIWLPQ